MRAWTRGTTICGAVTVIMTLACGGIQDEFDMDALEDAVEMLDEAAEGAAATDAPAAGSGSNTAACQAYIDANNAADCMPIKMDAADMCPDVMDMAGAPDMTEYYECMANGVKCNGAIPDLADQINCAGML